MFSEALSPGRSGPCPPAALSSLDLSGYLQEQDLEGILYLKLYPLGPGGFLCPKGGEALDLGASGLVREGDQPLWHWGGARW